MQVDIIKNIEQGSDEWHRLRLGVATASNFNRIITGTGKPSEQIDKYALELATQMLLINPEIGYINDAMAKGNALESKARDFYQEETFNSVETITMFKSFCGNFGYSPDGLVGDNGLIEVKSPNSTTHFKYIIDKEAPLIYKPQMQGGLWVSNREWIDFVSFCDNIKEKPIFIKRVYRDENYISQLQELVYETISKRNELLAQFRNS